jgi:Predicted Zn-dependent protease (DUF2268)
MWSILILPPSASIAYATDMILNCRSLAALILSLLTSTTAAADPFAARVRFEDVDRFYAILDKAGGKPTPDALQRDYLDAGSSAVRDFVPYRIESAEALAKTIAEQPKLYEQARSCRALLPGVDRRVRAAYLAFQQVLPEAKLPDTTILIGRGNSGGTSRSSGVLIGLEVVCHPEMSKDGGSAILAHLVAHELGHTQQAYFSGDTLLANTLNEGVAEFIGELISGQVSNPQHAAQVTGREGDIERAFVRDMRGTDRSRWLYNRPGTPQWPSDLGYWVGYRIAKSYFDRATDKRAAVREMLAATDAESFVKASGWTPAP